MENILQELEDEGYEIIVNFREKERKKIIRDSLKKIKENGNDSEIKYIKFLSRFYYILSNIGYLVKPEIPLEEDKCFLNYLHTYLDNLVDSSKRIIAGVIKAYVDDEPLDLLCKYLMLVYLYTPEQVVELGHEEIYKMEEKICKEMNNDNN